ncbi:hypothetical protein ElyMa_002383600 [Elysia marginata]|uniref:Uncharacterized protein n=1 Tax=Elysia marginata TaxID=1093978 RepID=A0AAV4GDS4_9GAST|nr:hypothetical protein ElyMa_002383600 [Elysia marginata]
MMSDRGKWKEVIQPECYDVRQRKVKSGNTARVLGDQREEMERGNTARVL